MFFLKIAFLENQDKENPYRDCRVGNIEHWSEEQKVLTTPNREPGREGPADQWEVEHIDYLAVQESRISSAIRE